MNKPNTVIYEGINPVPLFILIIVSILLAYVSFQFFYSIAVPAVEHPIGSVIFFGFVLVAIFYLWANTAQVFMAKPSALVLDDDGLHYDKLTQQIGVDTIPWQMLGTATVRHYHRSQIISVPLLDKEGRYVTHLSASHKRIFGDVITIFCFSLEANGKEMCSKINEFVDVHQQQNEHAGAEHIDAEPVLNA